MGIDPDDVVIHCVTKCCIEAESSINAGAFPDGYGKKNDPGDLHPYFSSFHLSLDDFDSRGNITFNETKTDVEHRGNWPYYQPVKCRRFGLRVIDQYDQGDETWLGMEN